MEKDTKNSTFIQDLTYNAAAQVYKTLSEKMNDYDESKLEKIHSECCDFDNNLDVKKIRAKIRRQYKVISEMIGPEIEKYNENEVSYFLEWYFFRDFDKQGTANILYGKLKDGSDFKRIHSHMKDGRFEYNYEAFIEEFMEIVVPLEAKQDLNDMHKVLSILLFGLREAIWNFKEASNENLPEMFLLDLRYRLEMIWGKLIEAFRLAKEEVEGLEDTQEHQAYISMLAIGYIEIVSAGIVNVLRTIAFLMWEQGEVTSLIEQIKSHMNAVKSTLQEEKIDLYRYDLKQNYTAKLWLRILHWERIVWMEIHKFLLREAESEGYSKYRKEFSVEQLAHLNPEEFDKLNLRSTGLQEDWKLIKKCFCEEGKSSFLDLKSFSLRFSCCKMVWKWYKEQRNQIVDRQMDWLTLKAIYRELYVYTKMPDIIKSVKTEGFIKLIKSGEFNNHAVMDEVETFYSFKIKRGMAREDNNLEAFKSTEMVLYCYYEYEKALFEKEWEGKYLSKILNCICGEVLPYKQ